MSSADSVAVSAARGVDDVCICGVGARTAVGLSAEASAAAVRASISGVAVHPSFVDTERNPVSFASDPLIEPEVPIGERMLTMVQTAADDALQGYPSPLRIDSYWLALPEPRAGLPTNLESSLAVPHVEQLGAARNSVYVISRGHAGGLMALQTAALHLSRGEGEAALVIGVDSYHDAQTVTSLDVHRRLMSARNRSGFPPGEAAGACLLVRGSVAARRRLPILARIRSGATAVEPHPLRSTEPCLAVGLTAAIASVLSGLQQPEERITATYCDLNGERYRSEEYVYAMLRTQAGFVDAHDYISPADCWGDVGAASGPLFAVLAIASSRRGYAKGKFPLLWAGSDGGHRSAVALEIGMEAAWSASQ